MKIGEKYIREYNEPFFLCDKKSIFTFIHNQIRNPLNYFGVVEEGKEVIAYLVALQGHSNHHSYVTGMSQVHCHVTRKGKEAEDLVVKLHNDFFRFVEDRCLEVAVTNSMLPCGAKFTEILKRHGWRQIGHARLMKLTKFHSGQSGFVDRESLAPEHPEG